MKKSNFSFFANFLVFGFFVFIFSGCGTTSIVTNKSDQLKGPYKKIFIALRSDIRTEPFTNPWMDNIAKDFQERHIELKTYFFPDQEDNSLSLQPDSVNSEIGKEINEFQPDAVMFIVLRKIEACGGMQVGKPGSNGGTFDLKLFDPADSHTPIWRANMKVYGDWGISVAVKKGTDVFLSKLEEDHIITPKS